MCSCLTYCLKKTLKTSHTYKNKKIAYQNTIFIPCCIGIHNSPKHKLQYWNSWSCYLENVYARFKEWHLLTENPVWSSSVFDKHNTTSADRSSSNTVILLVLTDNVAENKQNDQGKQTIKSKFMTKNSWNNGNCKKREWYKKKWNIIWICKK